MQRLVGRILPNIPLRATTGKLVSPAVIPGQMVLFFYPYTGRPGVADPEGWDEIPGAHGSTPQALEYSKLYDEFQSLGVKVFGVSSLKPDWQQEFVQRLGIKVPLLSDELGLFATALHMPTFQAGSQKFLRRITLLVRDGTVIGAHHPQRPEDDASQTLALYGRP